MRYVTGEEILAIHSDIIDETGGIHGVRDTGLFLSIIEQPKMTVFGKSAYPTIFHIAGKYLESFAQYQVFLDGNKRTGIAVAARSLYLNGFELSATAKELERFTFAVALKKYDFEEVVAWLKRKSKKSKSQTRT